MPVKFDLPKDNSSIIKVIGVGGGGSNAVNHMFEQGIRGVDFMVCNTDQQALDASPVPHKIQLGASLTEGRGAGSIPEVGRNSAIENLEEITEILEKNAKMVFVTAGMGGGTGTGAAPVIAKTAKESGILTVGIVTMPFFFEGRKRRQQAEAGIEAIRESVDTLLVINNDKLREMYGNLSLADAFEQADNVLTTAAKGIAEIITRTGYINVDFEDVRTVMTESGVAIMGSATAQGENRAMKAVEKALASPLLNDNNIEGARYVLLNITFGKQEVLMDEISDITDYIQDEAGATADVIWGYGEDETLGDEICVTLIATGFNTTNVDAGGLEYQRKQERTVVSLEEERPTTLTAPIEGTKKPEPKPAEEVAQEPYLKTRQPEPQEPVAQQSTMEFDLSQRRPEFTEPELIKREPAPEPVAQPEPEPVKEEPVAELPQESVAAEPVAELPTEPVVEATSEPVVEAPVNEAPAQPEEEVSMEPYLKSSAPAQPEPAAEPEQAKAPEQPRNVPQANPEDLARRASERIMKLKDLSLKLRTPSGIADLESEPAYKRRNVTLDDTPHSSESQVSRYTLTDEGEEGEEGRSGLRSNNSFLHDNVD